jgi:3-oxoacyl-[acyl-carrier protein] reductase
MSVAVITGGSSGLGLRLARKYTNQGYEVITCSRRGKSCENALSFQADFSRPESVTRFAHSIKKDTEKINVLINNAGISPAARILNFNEQDFLDTLQVNFNAARSLTECLRPLLSGGGSVVNIVSRVGIEGRIGLCAYGAAKGLLIGYTRGMAREFGNDNIRINCVNPGFMVTGMVTEKTMDRQKGESVLQIISDIDASAEFVYWISTIKWGTGQVFDFDTRIYSTWKTW